jgi:hypothetical protein
MSETRSRLLIEGKAKCYPGNSKHGRFLSKNGQDFSFKSSWEEAVMKYLDTRLDVMSWNYESIRISYIYNQNKRWYVPDFVITFQDNHKEIWEVKPKFHRNAEQVILKEAAARIWCSQNNVSTYRVLTCDDLRSMGII